MKIVDGDWNGGFRDIKQLLLFYRNAGENREASKVPTRRRFERVENRRWSAERGSAFFDELNLRRRISSDLQVFSAFLLSREELQDGVVPRDRRLFLPYCITVMPCVEAPCISRFRGTFRRRCECKAVKIVLEWSNGLDCERSGCLDTVVYHGAPHFDIVFEVVNIVCCNLFVEFCCGIGKE